MNYNISLVTKTYTVHFLDSFGLVTKTYLCFFDSFGLHYNLSLVTKTAETGVGTQAAACSETKTVRVFINHVHDTYVSLSTMFITAYAHLH